MSALSDRRIVVTRPAGRAESLLQRLRAAGARALHYPTIVTGPAGDGAALDAALKSLHHYDCVVFTSAAAVDSTFARCALLGVPPAAWNDVRIAAVGPATELAIRNAGRTPDLVPSRATGRALAGALSPSGQRFLFLRGNIAREDVPAAIRARGGEVLEVEAYRTEVRSTPDPGAGALLHSCDAITFTSPSTLRGMLNALGPREWPATAAIATIGPTTSAAVRDAGLAVHAEASPHSEDGLLAALQDWFSIRSGAE